jgi:hypothetical protein
VYSHFLRTTPSNDDSAQAIASLITALGYRTVCAIVYDDDYGNGLVARIRVLLLARGVQVDTAVVFSSTFLSTSSATTQININTNFSARGPWVEDIVRTFQPLRPKVDASGRPGDERCFVSVVCSNGLLPYITQALKDMGRLGPKFLYLLTDATATSFATTEGMLTPGFIRSGEPALSEVAEGWLAVSPDPGAATLAERLELNALWANRTSSATNNLTNLYYDNGDRVPSTVSTVYAYDAVMAYARALRSLYAGTAGPKTTTVPSPPLLSALYSLNFRGASGNVSFDRATGTRLGVGYLILNTRRVVNASGFPVPTMVRVGTMSTGVNASLDLEPGGATIVWPSGLSGLANAPSDRIIINKVIKVAPEQVAVCLGIAAVAIALAFLLSTAKLSMTLPPAVLSGKPTEMLTELLVWVTCAAEAWQLVSMALSAGPQDQGAFFSLRSAVFRWAKVEGVPQPLAFWIAAAITALVLAINLPLAALIFDADRPKAVLGPRLRRFFQSWLSSVSWLALFYC